MARQREVAIGGRTDARIGLLLAAIVITTGLTLGFALPPDAGVPPPWGRISSLLGWCYFAAWSASFWPQTITNFRLRSVEGLSLEFVGYNVIGFACYSAFNTALYFSDNVKSEYLARFGQPSAVQLNDVVFSLHALTFTLITAAQCLVYPAGSQKLPARSKWSMIAIVLLCFTYLTVLLGHGEQQRERQPSGGGVAAPWAAALLPLTWLDFLYFLSYVKMLLTLVKYVPQVWLNYTRKSTLGWDIGNVSLDFTGGVLSLAQLLTDSRVRHDWSRVTGDPVKFALGFFSLFFDVIFFVQHYVLYRSRRGVLVVLDKDGVDDATYAAGSTAPLLVPSDAVEPSHEEQV